jgi:hypothetical protein
MRSSILSCAVLLGSSWLSACGGVSNIGSGNAGGRSSAGSGGFELLAGFTGEGASGNGAVHQGGNGDGMGTAQTTSGAGGMSQGATAGETSVFVCKSDNECLGFGAECQLCPDGGYSCNSYCVNGNCVSKPGMCPATCRYDYECVIHDDACVECSDGTQCPTSSCQMGICRKAKAICGLPESCEGIPCGRPCKSCEPGNCRPDDPVSFCDDEGVCKPGASQCDVITCVHQADCGMASICKECSDGSCAAFGCIENQCQLTCTGSSVACKYTEECSMLSTECKKCPNEKCAVPACIQNGCTLVCPL